jgi:hypothetical protein
LTDIVAAGNAALHLTDRDADAARQDTRLHRLKEVDYCSHTKNARQILATLARTHGNACRGNGAEMLMALAEALEE